MQAYIIRLVAQHLNQIDRKIKNIDLRLDCANPNRLGLFNTNTSAKLWQIYSDIVIKETDEENRFIKKRNRKNDDVRATNEIW